MKKLIVAFEILRTRLKRLTLFGNGMLKKIFSPKWLKWHDEKLRGLCSCALRWAEHVERVRPSEIRRFGLVRKYKKTICKA